MKYTHPAYINEEIETVDVICSSPFKVAFEKVVDPTTNEVMKDENGNDLMKTVVSVDVGKLF